MVIIQLFIGASLAILVHELGHALVQWLFGIPVRCVEWGKGPLLKKIGILEIRLNLLAGGIYPNGAELAKSKWGAVLIAMGGILGQWVVTYIIALLHLQNVEWLRTIVYTFVFCSILALANFVPYPGTDGYYLVKALFRKDGAVS